MATSDFAWDLRHEQVDVTCQSIDSGSSFGAGPARNGDARGGPAWWSWPPWLAAGMAQVD